MIVKSLDSVYPQERALHKEKGVLTALDQPVQNDHQTPLEEVTKKEKARSRMSADEVMTFWNCLVPCGWSLGGLAAFLFSRKRKNAGRASGHKAALSSIIFGLLSTLCYLLAVLQAGNYGVTHPFRQNDF